MMIDSIVTAVEGGLRETAGHKLMDATKVQNLLLDIYNKLIKLRLPAEAEMEPVLAGVE